MRGMARWPVQHDTRGIFLSLSPDGQAIGTRGGRVPAEYCSGALALTPNRAPDAHSLVEDRRLSYLSDAPETLSAYTKFHW